MSRKSRVMAAKAGPVVVFLVGMRINNFLAFHKWLPVAIAMPRMIIELMKDRSLGLLGSPRTFVSGRLIIVQQYWENYEKLENYAGSSNNLHLPAWKAFNQASRNNSAVGIFHETYLVAKDSFESIYVNVNSPILLGSALGVEELTKTSNTSRQRLA